MLYFRYYIFINEKDKDKFEKAKIDYKNAVADLTEAIKIRPFDVLYYLNQGTFHSRLGEHKEAVEDFSQVINYSSGVLKEQLMTDVLIFELRGDEYDKLKNYGKALDDFQESSRLIPEIINKTCCKTNKERECFIYSSYSYDKCTFCSKCSFCGNNLYRKWKLKKGEHICLECFRKLSEKEKDDFMKEIILSEKVFGHSPLDYECIPLEYCHDTNYNEIKKIAMPSLTELRKVQAKIGLYDPEELE